MHAEFIGIFTIYINTKLHISCSKSSIGNAVKMNAIKTFSKPPLFSSPTKEFLNKKKFIFFEDVLTYQLHCHSGKQLFYFKW